MVNMHVRSNSYPSKFHPTINDVEDCLRMLKDLEATSVLAPSVCANMASLRDLNEAIATNLKETEAFGFLALRSILILVSGEKGRYQKRNWSFLPKFNQTNCLDSQSKEQKLRQVDINKPGKSMGITAEQNVLNQLKSLELILQEIEVGLQDLFRNVVRSRVSINVLIN